ncbi:pilus assembly protein [Fertoebacter nigrum]|uniref:Pilus assembly protein n=1 Tax=Fertoeibacter niger TaxID=2656921 RepID=A0A8X8GTM8_9RHOB|nr:TadE/TadG family type IV pilus assembly protein [Fertoeibacter niger]NUB44154.1 pilus assembly protein [Fertoeibacter niger]
MMRFMRRLGRGFRCENGSATVEFVLTVPVLFTIFMASFESGLLMTRSILLEQAVDRTMRELRLGHLPNATHDSLKTEICDRTVILANCAGSILIELVPVNTNTWVMPTTTTTCADRSDEIQPVTTFTQGGENNIMLVRVCVIQDPIFPTTGIGLALPKDGSGGYGLLAASAFVNEP